MKIYDTYRFLFESDEELLDEVAWTKNKAKMFTRGDIPLTPTVVKKLLGEPERIEAFHITDENNVNEIKKIIIVLTKRLKCLANMVILEKKYKN